MGLINKIKELFAEIDAENVVPMAFVDVKTDDGRILRISDLAVDGTVTEITENGEAELEDGNYILEDGVEILVEAGKIVEVKEPEAEEAPAEDAAPVEEAMASVNLMDGTPVYFDGELAVGTAIFIDEAMTSPAPDGEHEMEDGSKIVIAAGLITEMAPAEDAAAVEEEMSAELFMDITLKDGPIAHVVTATEGSVNAGDRMMIDQVEAGPGEYETTNGNTLVVGDAGVISEVRDTVAATSDVPTDEDVQGVVNNLKNLVKQIKDLKSQFDEVKATIENLENENKELKEEVSKFAGSPSAAPTKTKVDFSKADKSARLDFFSKK